MPEITFRPYQIDAVESLFRYFERAKGNPLIVLPTGSGKSYVLAEFCRRAIESFPSTTVLIMTHRKELIQQDYDAIRTLWPAAPIGIYSAGLLSKEIRQITVGGIQSLHRADLPAFDLVIIDEAHLVPKQNTGMYRDVLADLAAKNPNVKTIGLTATPYRVSGGFLTHGKEKFFSSIAYETPVQDLVDQGFLAPLVAPRVATQIDADNIGTRNGDFITKDLALASDREEITWAALDECVIFAKDRQSWLVYCVTVEHAENVLKTMRMLGIRSEIITGETDAGQRSRIIEQFKRREIRALVSVDVLTTGFDAPAVDCIVLLRPTASTGLYVQILGRGMRLSPGKANCIVLDFGGNVERHGPITHVRPKSKGEPAEKGLKLCPNCTAEVAAWKTECPECGHTFEGVPREVKHDTKASTKEIMAPAESDWLPVHGVAYERHEKADKPPTVRVRYQGAFKDVVSEWVCPQHMGYARQKFVSWWVYRGGPLSDVPSTVEETIERAPYELKTIDAVKVKREGQYDRLSAVRFRELTPQEKQELAEIPF